MHLLDAKWTLEVKCTFLVARKLNILFPLFLQIFIRSQKRPEAKKKNTDYVGSEHFIFKVNVNTFIPFKFEPSRDFGSRYS